MLELKHKLALSSDKSNIQNENVDCESVTASRVMNAGDLIKAREKNERQVVECRTF